MLEEHHERRTGSYVFPGHVIDNAVGNVPQNGKKLLPESPLWDVTAHVSRHSFASMANDLGFTEVTLASLIGHAKGSATSKYIHRFDTALVMAADTVSGDILALLEGAKFQRYSYSFDKQSRQATIAKMLLDAGEKR